MIVSLEALKAHLNITLDNEDDLLSQKLETAEAAVANFTGLEFATEYTDEKPVPAPIKEAILQFAAHLYDYREPTELDGKAPSAPLGVFDLIGPYKKWNF